jgi:hypothetical protein
MHANDHIGCNVYACCTGNKRVKELHAPLYLYISSELPVVDSNSVRMADGNIAAKKTFLPILFIEILEKTKVMLQLCLYIF